MSDYSKKMLVSALVPVIVFILAALNNYLASKGAPCLSIGDEQLTQWVSQVVEYLAALWAWWKNNNITKNAQQAQRYLDELKNE